MTTSTSRLGRSNAPPPLNAGVSRQLSRMPVRNTKPEVAVRQELHRRGLRFTLHPAALPGRPDIWFSRARIAVFVDGCFWHACPEHGVIPVNNHDWWVAKLNRNRDRDRDKDEQLAAIGCAVLHVWEHETPAAAADKVEEIWRQRTGVQRASPRRPT